MAPWESATAKVAASQATLGLQHWQLYLRSVEFAGRLVLQWHPLGRAPPMTLPKLSAQPARRRYLRRLRMLTQHRQTRTPTHNGDAMLMGVRQDKQRQQ